MKRPYALKVRAFRAIASCENPTQLAVAGRYVESVEKKTSEEFVRELRKALDTRRMEFLFRRRAARLPR